MRAVRPQQRQKNNQQPPASVVNDQQQQNKTKLNSNPNPSFITTATNQSQSTDLIIATIIICNQLPTISIVIINIIIPTLTTSPSSFQRHYANVASGPPPPPPWTPPITVIATLPATAAAMRASTTPTTASRPNRPRANSTCCEGRPRDWNGCWRIAWPGTVRCVDYNDIVITLASFIVVVIVLRLVSMTVGLMRKAAALSQSRDGL